MDDLGSFYNSILESLTEHICVIDASGTICFVNHAWKSFGLENNVAPEFDWIGVNYFNACSNIPLNDSDASAAISGIEGVINGHEPVFYLEYPCHSTTCKRWFMMRVTPLNWPIARHFVVSHQNITQRVLAEQKVAEISMTDGLTGIANRRHFDSFLADEWQRNSRDDAPLSLALIDIDAFKSFNDTHGHIAGDQCLRVVADVLKRADRRPGDLAARFGGDEFALILGSTDHNAARQIANKVLLDIRSATSSIVQSPSEARISASIGVATIIPTSSYEPNSLIKLADRALYEAKALGRDRVCIAEN